MGKLDERLNSLKLMDKASKNKADRASLIAEVNKATTVAQLKAVVLQLIQRL